MGTKNFSAFGTKLIHSSNMYTIRKRSESRCWEFKLTNGNGSWLSTRTKNISQVEENVNRILAQMGKQTVTGMKLNDFALDFFEKGGTGSIRAHNEKMNKNYEDTWYEQNQARLNNYILPDFGHMYMQEITDVMIEDWYINLHSMYDSRKELADGTKVKVLNTFKVVMKEAKRRRLIEINPCDTVERMIVQSKQRGFFTQEEISTLFPSNRIELLNIWRTLQWALFFSIMVDTGWRCGEVSALTKHSRYNDGIFTMSSVDCETKRLKNSIKTTKKGQPYKVGILSDYTQELFDDFVKGWDREELFYIETSHALNTPDCSNNALEKALKRVGIEKNGRSQHCFRHSFDTYMLNNINGDVNKEDVLELMAHTSYRPEYDHRNEEDIINRLSKAKPLINKIRIS